MKVAIDLTALAFNFSGIERFALNISQHLLEIDKEDEFYLLFCNEIHEAYKVLVREKSNIHAEILKACHNKKSKLLLFQYKIPKKLRELQADCYLFLAFSPPIFFKERNIVATFHDIGYFDCPSMWKWYVTLYGRMKLKAALRHGRRLISVSDFTKQRMRDRLHAKTDKITVIHNGVDERFNNLELPSADKERIMDKYHLPESYYLCLGTLEPRKNLKLLIEAYTELFLDGQINKKLVLAGRKGWKTDEFLKEIPKKVKSHICFTGFIDDRDLPAVYKLADRFIFPSLYEGFGIPPLEAMACGTEVIVSDIPIFQEILGEAAIYFKNNCKDDLKRTMVREADREKEVLLRQAGKYSWRKSAERYYDVLHGKSD